MPIPVTCAKCGFEIQAPNHVAGRTLRCFKCLTPFTVPKQAPVAAFAPTPAPLAAFAPAPAPVDLFDPVPALDPVSPPMPSAPKEPEPAPEFELDAGALLLEPDTSPAPADLEVVEDAAVLEEDLEVVDAADILLEEEPPAKGKKKKK